MLSSLRDQHNALIHFSDEYNYFGSGRVTKLLVRVAVMLRYYLKVLEYHLERFRFKYIHFMR